MSDITLSQYGWNKELANNLSQGETRLPARVIAEYGMNYRVAAPDEITCEIPGRMLHELSPTERPKVGDWVLIERIDTQRGLIHVVLPRKSEIARLQSDRSRVARRPEKQVLAVNVDIALLVQSLDQDFSPARLERYQFALAQSGIMATIVLNKADINPSQIDSAASELADLELPVIIASAKTGRGIKDIEDTIGSGQTAVFLGSSGVGKSSITNRLLGEARQVTAPVRSSDSKGRHTTSHRELFLLPGGGLLIDTPGLRELQLWGSEGALETVFADIDTLALNCQYTNCTHLTEPGCAVQEAITTGQLMPARLVSYRTFQQELRAVEKMKYDS
jgi:ribosome biogenesis GTPase